MNEERVAVRAQFERAAALLHAKPLSKLLRIGPIRFLRRGIPALTGRRQEYRRHLFFGESMTVALPEIISKQIFTYGLFDEIVTHMAISIVRNGDTVLDIGAHFGYFTLLFAHLSGPTGRCIALEPTPSTFTLLKSNISGIGNATAYQLAAGRSPGTVELQDFGFVNSAWNTLNSKPRLAGLIPPSVRVSVEVVRLDDWLEKVGAEPRVIKIDAENFEAEVIGGLERTIKRLMPRIIMETGSEESLKAIEHLVSLGYKIHIAEDITSIKPWNGEISAANGRYKDLLLLPGGDHLD